MPKTVLTNQTVDNIKRVGATLREAATLLDVIADQAQQSGFDALDVTNYDQLKRALQYIDNYTLACRSGLGQAREDRGDFRKK